LCDGEVHCGDGSDEDRRLCSEPLQIRLVEGPTPYAGRVEIRHKGVWGTICDDHFNIEESKVVCRMLGFPTQNAQLYNGTKDYSAGQGPVWIRLTEDKVCAGNELNLAECKERNLWSHDHHCSHAEDVAVSCEHDDRYTYSGANNEAIEDDLRGDFVTVDMLSNEATVSLTGPTEGIF
jgi:hypothetical protein